MLKILEFKNNNCYNKADFKGVLMKEKANFLQKTIPSNVSVIVAVSGGPDSMLLLSLLNEIKCEKKLSLICAHVNHKVRKESEEEALFVKKYCQENQIIFEYLEITNYRHNHFTEEEAREKRIQFFLSLAKKYQAYAIATAHHADDLMETMLMKIMRGSTLNSIASMQKETTTHKTKFIKPLLDLTKKEIIAILENNKQPYVIDKSNEEDCYLRNRLRHHVIPVLKQEDPKIHQKFLKLQKEINEEQAYLKEECQKLDAQIKNGKEYSLIKYLELPNFLKIKYMRHILEEIYQDNITSMKEKNYQLILKFLQSSTKSSQLELPQHYILYKQKSTFQIFKKPTTVPFCLELKENQTLENGDQILEVDKYTQTNNNEIHLNSKQITLPLFITTRKDGMKMGIKNFQGHQKIKNILMEANIPAPMRDQVPIIVDAKGEVIWIPGIKKSFYDLDKNENYDIIYKYIKKEGN